MYAEFSKEDLVSEQLPLKQLCEVLRNRNLSVLQTLYLAWDVIRNIPWVQLLQIINVQNS